MKRSFKRSKRGGRRGAKARQQLGGMLKWSGTNFVPQSFMTKHPYVYREDDAIATTNSCLQWLLNDIGHPFTGGGDFLPRGVDEMDDLYQIWQVLAISYELTYINQSGGNVEITVYPSCNVQGNSNYIEVRNNPFAKRRLVQNGNSTNGTDKLRISGYVSVKGLDGTVNSLDLLEYQGAGLGVGGGPDKDYRLNLVMNAASVVNLDWVLEMRIVYYVKWSCARVLTQQAVLTSREGKTYKECAEGATHPNVHRLKHFKDRNRILTKILALEIEDEKKEEGLMDIEEESMNSSPPSSIPGTTSGVKKMGFKTA